MSKRYEVHGEGIAKQVCWRSMNVPLSKLFEAVITEFHDVRFDDLEISPSDDGEYIFLQHKDRYLEEKQSVQDTQQRRDRYGTYA